jgi:formylglycine-generating enzyme required for sulfatase activity
MAFQLFIAAGAFIGGVSSAIHGHFSRKNTEKSQQLQVQHHQEIVVREKERVATQEKIEYARLMCQRIQQQEILVQQEQQRDLDRQLQSQENSLNREFQRKQQQDGLSFQGEQRGLDRQLQVQLADLSREFQAQENERNRDLQLTLTELNQEFQSQQGELSRAFSEKLEVFRADLQKYFFEQQRELQMQLKEQDIELARELRKYDRQTAITVVEEQKRQNNSPIWLVAGDLLKRGNTSGVLPLNVFFSPPVLKFDRTKESDAKGFPAMEDYLQQELRKFFQQYQGRDRQIDYLAGAWTSKQFSNEAAARQIFLGLQSEPTLILESALEGENLSISFAYWGLGHIKERYETVMRFSWLEVLYSFVKERTETWFRNRAVEGSTEAEWIEEYGEKFVRQYQANRGVMAKEQRWIDRGDDIRELERNYHLAPKDWDQLKRLVAICHCAIAGWVTDEYFLLDVNPDRRQLPLLPELLSDLVSGMSETVQHQFIDGSVHIYQKLYDCLISEVPDWEPELRLELATSLIKLPSHDAGLAQINASLRVWLFSRGVDWSSGTPVLSLLSSVAKPEDEAYFRSLYQVWELVGINDKVDMGGAYYRRGESFLKRRDYSAASADFERAIALGHTEAVQRRELVVHLQEHISDEKRKLQEAEHAAALAKQQQQAEALERRELERKLQEAEEKAKRQAFTWSQDVKEEIDIELVNIPAGSFMMGDDDGYDDEKPAHRVTLKAFQMSKYPITQKQYQLVMGSNPSIFKSDENCPVEGVSWYDAMEFCEELSKRIGQKVKLPTEAQWEYACRAGSTGKYCFGDDVSQLRNYAWYNGNSGDEPHPVGEKLANSWGLYDMHGNVCEWCEDVWHENYNGAPTDGSAWLTGGEQHKRVRGGSWNDDDHCRSAYRNSYDENWWDISLGFRVVV